MTDHCNLENYLLNLEGKGFKFKGDAISFIYFGKQLTGSADFLVSLSIELTLITQKRFDGSFYLSLLETLKENKITTRTQAYSYVKSIGLLKAHS
ncbi:hypothetical protein KHA89_03680 [Bacillus sp. FJAT-49731]|uniref:Uncharacterized protein n=1 Tax=Lederbergia citrea TaxID=2833581 RepID=A0A942UNJ0_9BACI|nr:hypothetical protein [Lederbergia citrea]MBS4203183.1 hypothetical protein [Lederbergia citrea]MBS4222146.1 hypothetical protein [Lederbergia citrea]